ncbi:hypothetical protein HON86_03715 [Candidatus Woesearchaeota archaeon]|jgi:hypothetical protein|nr:hypothetical protein [Candidatus Woesearchaeota archaeon]MBT4835691.1 hypothetical protein [Candidatus Woesearchaeota archaeon]MBT6735313.1 hypothetical protein [Candidatus Woesearchaeota archaeon]MBT7169485.1 hypothetical protein [Candidatus Woesearchaeota archaeon]MBT7474695.1 hypothetical protein [Candidatus Woesearchaeota archaeon]
MDDYNSRLEEITSLLDKRVDDANTDPTYNHPILSEDENYLPVRKNKSWPSEFGSDSYSWRMIIEPGTIKSSAMINLNYSPNPLKSMDENTESMNEYWGFDNPDLNLNKGVFMTKMVKEGEYQTIVTNSLQEILENIDYCFDKLAKSRTQDFEEF